MMNGACKYVFRTVVEAARQEHLAQPFKVFSLPLRFGKMKNNDHGSYDTCQSNQ